MKELKDHASDEEISMLLNEALPSIRRTGKYDIFDENSPNEIPVPDGVYAMNFTDFMGYLMGKSKEDE